MTDAMWRRGGSAGTLANHVGRYRRREDASTSGNILDVLAYELSAPSSMFTCKLAILYPSNAESFKTGV
jgi:hypothetical protein